MSESAGREPATTPREGGTLYEGVAASVAHVLCVDRSRISPGTSLIEMGAESFDFAALVFALERKYGIRMPTGLLTPGRQTVEDYVRAVRARLDEGVS